MMLHSNRHLIGLHCLSHLETAPLVSGTYSDLRCFDNHLGFASVIIKTSSVTISARTSGLVSNLYKEKKKQNYSLVKLITTDWHPDRLIDGDKVDEFCHKI